jgi:carbonic anhydrase
MKTLLDGYARFRKGYWRRHKKRFSALARNGQSPAAMVIACADSRVAPEAIFDCAPGEIFVARNVSNLVPPYAPDTSNHGTSAALEFAVTMLGVSTIVVLGHSQCGGIRALMNGHQAGRGDFIQSWMEIANSARQRVCDAPDAREQTFDTLCTRCEHETIRVSLANLLTFPWVAARVAEHKLTLVGMHFSVMTGRLETIT